MPASFESRTLVNGSMLRHFSDKNVSIMVRVEDEDGINLNALSTDGQRVRVTLPEPLGARKGNWVEIIGTAKGSDEVRAKDAILFGAENVDFDEDGYNMMVQIINNAKDIFCSR